jgi:hypothetical protein
MTFRGYLLLCLGVLAVALVSAAPAAATPRWSDGSVAEPYARWITASNVPVYSGDVVVVPEVGACAAELGEGVFGCTLLDSSPPIVELASWLRRVRRFAFFHEAGHIFDAAYLTPELRAEFLWINNINGGWEEPRPTLLGDRAPLEEFADAYAFCAIDPTPEFAPQPIFGEGLFWTGPPEVAHVSAWAWSPRRWQFKRTCGLIRRSFLG